MMIVHQSVCLHASYPRTLCIVCHSKSSIHYRLFLHSTYCCYNDILVYTATSGKNFSVCVDGNNEELFLGITLWTKFYHIEYM